MTSRRSIHPQHCSGYTLVELAIATSVLATGIAAAAALSMSAVQIEDINHRKARVLALTEAAARLWQLGLTPAQVAEIVPGDPALASIDFSAVTDLVPHDRGTPIDNPAADLGVFQGITITASVLVRPDSSPTDDDGQVYWLFNADNPDVENPAPIVLVR